jgi:hypothetical protein
MFIIFFKAFKHDFLKEWFTRTRSQIHTFHKEMLIFYRLPGPALHFVGPLGEIGKKVLKTNIYVCISRYIDTSQILGGPPLIISPSFINGSMTI